MYQPEVGDDYTIDGDTWYVLEHPAAPGSGIPYGQEGRVGIVYQLANDDGVFRALKAFKPTYRQPYLVSLARKLAAFANLPGLAVCSRQVLTPQNHGDLLRQYPDFLYAAFMPWIEGQTWHEILQQEPPPSPQECLAMANSLADILAQLEQEGVAHGDLSDGNLIIDGLDKGTLRVELVDVEQLYGPGLTQPSLLSKSTPGYAHKTAKDGLWEPAMDRFAGAVLLAEMLGWCDERIRAAASGQTYFAGDELQEPCSRYVLLRSVLAERWGEPIAMLFEQAWNSETVTQCPPFGAWQIALPPAVQPEKPQDLDTWLATAQTAMAKEDWPAALAAYRQALLLVEPNSGLAQELPLIIVGLGDRVSRVNAADAAADTEEPRTTEEPLEPGSLDDDSNGKPFPWLRILAPLATVVVIGLVVFSVLRGCQGPELEEVAELTSTATSPPPTTTTISSPESTSSPPTATPLLETPTVSTPLPTRTPRPTATQPLPTATPIPLIDESLLGNTLPMSEVIARENAASLTEFARLGRGRPQQASWSTDSGSVYLATTAGVYVLDVETGDNAKVIQSDTLLSAVAINETGDLLATGDWEGTIQVWDAETGQLIHRIPTSDGLVRELAFNPNSNLLASIGSFWGIPIRIIDAESGRAVRNLSGHPEGIWDIEFNSGGNRLVSAGEDGSARVWDITTGGMIGSFANDSAEGSNIASNVAFHPDGQYIAVAEGGPEGTVTLWDIQSKELIDTNPFSGYVTSLSFEPSGETLAVAVEETVQFWPMSGESSPGQIFGHDGYIAEIGFSPDGDRLVTIGFDALVKIWDSDSKTLVREFQYSGPAQTVDISKDNDLVASATYNDTQFFSPANGQQLAQVDSQVNVEFSPVEDLVALGWHSVEMWDIPAGSRAATIGASPSSDDTVAFSSDGTLLAIGTNSSVVVWDVVNDRRLQTLSGSNGRIESTDISADGSLVAAATDSGNVHVWFVDSGEQLQRIEAHSGRATSVAFNPEGTLVASGGADSRAIVWDVESGAQVFRTSEHDNWVWDVAFSPDGSLLATGARGITLWDVESGSRLNRFGDIGVAGSLAFSLDGRLIVFGGNSGLIHIWGVPGPDGPTSPIVTDSPGSDISVSVDSPSPVESGATELRVWTDAIRAPALASVKDDFEAAYGVDLILEEYSFGDIRTLLSTAAPAGSGPDIILGAHDWLGELVTSGLLVPLDLGSEDRDFTQPALQAFTYESALYGLPYGTENIALFINTDLVAECPTSWTEVYDISKELNGNNASRYGFVRMESDPFHFYPIQTAFGGYVFGRDRDGNHDPGDVGVGNDGSIAAGQWLERMVQEGLQPSGMNWETMHSQFESTTAAMILTGPWALVRLQDAGVPYDICPIPSEIEDGRPFVGALGFMVSAFSEAPLLAQVFLTEYVATTDTMLALYEADPRVPAYLPALELINDADFSAFAEAGMEGEPMPAIPEMSSVWQPWDDALTLISQGTATAEEAFTRAQQQVEDAIGPQTRNDSSDGDESVASTVPLTATTSSESTGSFSARAKSDVFTREGPSLDYSISGSLSKDEEISIVARDSGGRWLLATGPGNRLSWVPADLVTASVENILSLEISATLPAQISQLAEVEIFADQTWQPSGSDVLEGNTILIEVVSGSWTHHSGTIPLNAGSGEPYRCSNLIPASECDEPLPSFAKGALIASVGNLVLAVGTRRTITMSEGGELFLRINDGDDGLYDNSGSLTVRLSEVNP